MKKKNIEDFIDYVYDLVYQQDLIQKVDVIKLNEKLQLMHVKKNDINKIIDIVDDEIYSCNILSNETEKKIIKILRKY